MKEFIEKLIGRLEEYKYSHLVERDSERLEHCKEKEKDCEGTDCFFCLWDKSIEIVNQLAEEYNNGWIPVGQRLPSKEEYLKNDGRFIVTDGNRCYQSVFDVYSQKFRTSIFTTFGSYRYEEDKCVLAWKKLPEPYKG